MLQGEVGRTRRGPLVKEYSGNLVPVTPLLFTGSRSQKGNNASRSPIIERAVIIGKIQLMCGKIVKQ